jgi:hypothetical protein
VKLFYQQRWDKKLQKKVGTNLIEAGVPDSGDINKYTKKIQPTVDRNQDSMRTAMS